MTSFIKSSEWGDQALQNIQDHETLCVFQEVTMSFLLFENRETLQLKKIWMLGQMVNLMLWLTELLLRLFFALFLFLPKNGDRQSFAYVIQEVLF